MSTNGSGGYEQQIRAADQALADLEAEAAEAERRLAAAARHRENLIRESTSHLRRSTMSDADKSRFIRDYPDGPQAAIQAYFKLPE